MAEWLDVAALADFPEGSVQRLDVDGTPVAVFHRNGHFYAIEDVCTHEAETLSTGEIDGLEILCPRHFARFSLVTGEALSPPAYESVNIFPTRVSEGRVQIGIG